MQLLPHAYHRLALLVHTDELIAAGMSRRRAKMVAVLRLLERSFKHFYCTL
jgi:hypothetical protein